MILLLNLKKTEINNKNHYFHSYIELLRHFQQAYEDMPENSEILSLNKCMQDPRSPFLLALGWKQRDGNETDHQVVPSRVCDRPHNKEIVMIQKFSKPEDIVVVDGTSLHDVFGDVVYYAPQDDLVESECIACIPGLKTFSKGIGMQDYIGALDPVHYVRWSKKSTSIETTPLPVTHSLAPTHLKVD